MPSAEVDDQRSHPAAPPDPGYPDEYTHLEPLLARFAATDPDDPDRAATRDRLFDGLSPIATHIARRYADRGEPFDDLHQVARLGLLHAIDRYQPGRGPRFLAFAVPTVSGEVRRHFRDHTWGMRVPRRLKELRAAINSATVELGHDLGRAPRPSEIAGRLGLPVEQVLEGLEAAQAYRPDSLDGLTSSDDDNPATVGELFGFTDRNYEFVTQSRAVAPVIAALPPRDRAVLVMRFYRDLTQSQIATQIGVSQMQVSRILTQTLSRIRDEVEHDPRPDDQSRSA